MRHLGPERVAEDLAKASTQMPLPPGLPAGRPRLVVVEVVRGRPG